MCVSVRIICCDYFTCTDEGGLHNIIVSIMNVVAVYHTYMYRRSTFVGNTPPPLQPFCFASVFSFVWFSSSRLSSRICLFPMGWTVVGGVRGPGSGGTIYVFLYMRFGNPTVGPFAGFCFISNLGHQHQQKSLSLAFLRCWEVAHLLFVVLGRHRIGRRVWHALIICVVGALEV